MIKSLLDRRCNNKGRNKGEKQMGFKRGIRQQASRINLFKDKNDTNYGTTVFCTAIIAVACIYIIYVYLIYYLSNISFSFFFSIFEKTRKSSLFFP